MFSSASRRPSLSATGSSTHLPQGIGYSPGPSSTPPASSGIPVFRSLRSLLPFGPNKNATPNTSFASSSPNTSKSPFAAFGSARRSIQKDRERNVSLSNDLLRPVITIERNSSEEGAVRRSVSFSDLERPEQTVDADAPSTPLNMSAFSLRTPSPGPPLFVDLSTIMEADNSGVSKNPPTPMLSSPPVTPHLKYMPPSQPIYPVSPNSNHQENTVEGDTSALNLSTAHVADQVRNAILSSDSVKQWRNVDKAVVIIDADEKDNLADTSFCLDNPDPQLFALLSPNSLKNTKPMLRQPPPSPSPPASSAASPHTRLPRARQASSFLPRLRPSTSPTTTSPSQNSTPVTTPSTSTAPQKTSPAKGKTPIIAINDSSAPSSPKSPSNVPATTPVLPARGNLSLSRPGKLFTSERSSSLSYSQVRGLSGEKDSNPVVASPTISKGPARTLRRVVLGVTGYQPPSNTSTVATPTPSPTRAATFGRASLDLRRPPTSTSEIGLGRPSLEIQRGNAFDSRLGRRPSPVPLEPRSSISGMSERTETAVTTPSTETGSPMSSPEMMSCEDPTTPVFQRPSVDSTARPSLDGATVSRPGSAAARLLERKTPSSRIFESSAERERLVVPRESARSRKRSMSVQERVGRVGRLVSGSANVDTTIGGVGVSRPGSSLSVGRPSRGGGVQGVVGEHGEKLAPKLEWLGPRTVKAFRAAGLLDPDREKALGVKERDAGSDLLRGRSGSGSGMLAPSPLGNHNNNSGSVGGASSALNRFASLRGFTTESNRAQSRMAFSEVGGPTSRRGSESLSAHSGGGNGFGLMESPTFTGSSGSRGERDTPRSASTAPTSLSDTFGYFGRDRERDRDKDEIRELRDRHATEVAALLAALSDSQRTVRMLRDENSGLRERLERFAGVLDTNDELRQACADLQRECHDLRRECAGLHRESTPVSYRPSSVFRAPGIASSWSGGSTSTNSSLRTAVPKLATSSPLATDVTPRFEVEEEEYNNTVIIHDSIDDRADPLQRRRFTSADGHSPLDDLLPTSTSTPSASRRHSNTSSIFPAPPANMSMLDDEGLPLSNRSSADQFDFGSGSPMPSSSKPRLTPKAASYPTSHSRSSSTSSLPPVTFKNLANPTHYPAKSIISTSGANISPTTAEFSMITGSPRSLFLRPEHEQLLGDLESLDLGAIPPIDLGTGKGRDDW